MSEQFPNQTSYDEAFWNIIYGWAASEEFVTQKIQTLASEEFERPEVEYYYQDMESFLWRNFHFTAEQCRLVFTIAQSNLRDSDLAQQSEAINGEA